MAGLGTSIVNQVILLVAGVAPAHGQRHNFFGHSKRFYVAVTIATNFLHRAFLPEIKSLNMAFVVKAHKVGLVMHFLKGNRLFLIPIFKQFYNTRLVSHRGYILMAADTLLQRGNAGDQ
ncbi:MAG TPA: hypothetical protein VKJ65_11820, partial [Phycisphaerae bacterium]|nr:hypothetical protein [Phycisphaerae bacterium]